MSEAAATLKDPVKRRVGLKQVRRPLAATEAETLFAARDADQRLLAPLMHMAEEQGVPVAWVDTMRELGKACGIQTGAAIAAALRDINP